MDYELLAFMIALLSLVISGIALGWNIFRDCIDKPKLKLNMFVANWYDPNRGEMPQVISVTVTNTGRQPIVIKGHGFPLKDKTTSIFPDVMDFFDQKKLEPYDRLEITLPHPVLKTLIEKADDISAFIIYDTTGRQWKLASKTFKEFKKTLLAKKPKPAAQKLST